MGSEEQVGVLYGLGEQPGVPGSVSDLLEAAMGLASCLAQLTGAVLATDPQGRLRRDLAEANMWARQLMGAGLVEAKLQGILPDLVREGLVPGDEKLHEAVIADGLRCGVAFVALRAGAGFDVVDLSKVGVGHGPS